MKVAAMFTQESECEFFLSLALRDPDRPLPDILTAASFNRFSVYRNNIAVRLIETLEAGFPAVRAAVGEAFFAATARVFVTEHPPRTRILAFYGAELPAFLWRFPPAAEIPYLPDLAQIDAGRTRAAYAADVEPLSSETLAQLEPEMLASMRVRLHPSVMVLQSLYPIATIWAMNTGVLPVAPIEDWRPEDVVIARPETEVEVRRLPPGGAVFLNTLARDENLAEAATAAPDAAADFDLGFALACLCNFGLATKLLFASRKGH
jgi:Putative DNA-binding domain